MSSKMQFEFDPETLIEEVKKRPGLWDHEILEYRSKHYKQDAWKDIVRTLSGSSDFSKAEMRDIELQLQKKWKGLRDSYNKQLRNPNRQRRPYIHTKQLSFLKPRYTNSKPGETRSDDCFNHSEEETSKVKKLRRHEVLVKKERKSEDNSADNESYLDMSCTFSDDDENESGNENNYNLSTSAKKVEKFAFANVAVTNNLSNDCDRLFLLSMLPYLKSIPDQYKLKVKMELMQVIQNARSFEVVQNGPI